MQDALAQDRRAPPMADETPPGRVAVRVRGLVQGVGFRPHVARVAMAHGISGFVRNDSDGVRIEAEGASLDAFLRALRDDAPPLARITHFEVTPATPGAGDATDFAILSTDGDGAARTVIGPDVGLCEDCLGELFEPGNRRYLHPFICCTNCGPRYTVARSLPYDRAQTSMAGFAMCAECAREYGDPDDRRFHAEPIACNACGPRMGRSTADIAGSIAAGEIVALKGLGGFHLACDARNADAVARLRRRKRRDGKPFAVMVLNLESARRIADIDAVSASLLEDRARPIVLVDAKRENGLPPGIANGLPSIGLMLAYTPLHYLAVHALAGRPAGTDWLRQPSDIALVMTSANRSGDALVTDDAEAETHLAGIADVIAGHDRQIVTRADDSVIRVIGGAPAFVRRARGYAPLAVPFTHPEIGVLALGAHLKATVTLTRGDEAFVSQHIGDLDTASNRTFLKQTADHLGRILEVRPDVIACDLHRDYASSRIAEEMAAELDVPLVAVQHHHAHIAAATGEHGIKGPVIGLSLDGHGLGTDGTAWGGELFLVDGADFERIGRLAPLALAGGDRAAREPWRMAAAALHRLGRGDEIARRFADEAHADPLARLLASGHAPKTTSAGRCFDAAAGLLGVLTHQRYEGEAAMRLEGLVREHRVLDSGWRIDNGTLDLLPLLSALADCTDARHGAELFHGTLIAALACWARAAAETHGCQTIALGGGCFLNRHLCEGLAQNLGAAGLKVVRPSALPANDGGLSYGQAVVAAAATRQE